MPTSGPRRYLLDHALLYLFSYDVELDIARQEIGPVPGGLRTNVFCIPQQSRVYSVSRDNTVADDGAAMINGQIIWGGDWSLIREDDVAVSNVRLTIHTVDGSIIDGSYQGIVPLMTGGFERVAREKPKVGSEDEPFNASVVINPYFVTSDPRYDWIMDRQCIGFGELQVIENILRRASYDIYAMD